MGGAAGRPAALRLCPPAAPGAGHHRAGADRPPGPRAAQGLATDHGRGRQRHRPFQGAGLHRGDGQPRVVRAGLLPQGIRALPDHGSGPWRARRRHRGRDQSQADLGRRLADQGRQGRLRLRRRPAGPAGGASGHLAGAARHRHAAPAAGGGGARLARRQQQRGRRHEPRRRLGALRPRRDPGAEMAGLRRGADHRGAATGHQCRPARACRCWCWAC